MPFLFPVLRRNAGIGQNALVYGDDAETEPPAVCFKLLAHKTALLTPKIPRLKF